MSDASFTQVMMKNGMRFFLMTACVSTLALSCGESADEGEELTALDATEEKQEEEVNKMFVSVPTPSELITFINEAHSDFNSELLNNTDRISDYAGHKSKALNFGVYGTDMVYASSYGEGTRTLNYFAALSKLADELEIADAFDPGIMDQLQKDNTTAEALMSISDDTYYSSYAYLEENDRGNVLSLIIAGGWLESVYLASHLISNYEPGSVTVTRLTDQKLTLENVIDFMSYHKEDPQVSEVISDLAELLLLFDEVEEVEVEAAAESSSGRMILGGAGGTRMEQRMTEEQFNKIVSKVAELRTNIVGTAS